MSGNLIYFILKVFLKEIDIHFSIKKQNKTDRKMKIFFFLVAALVNFNLVAINVDCRYSTSNGHEPYSAYNELYEILQENMGMPRSKKPRVNASRRRLPAPPKRKTSRKFSFRKIPNFLNNF